MAELKAGRDSLRGELATAKHDAERWKQAHDRILAEAARLTDESELRTMLTASQERGRKLRVMVNQLAVDHPKWCKTEPGGCSCGLTELRAASALATPEGTARP